MKRFGRFLSLASISLSAMLLFSACGTNKNSAGDNSNESKSIRVFFGDTVGTDNAEVSKAVSELSQEKIGVEVEMVFFGAGEYDTKMPKLMATNEKMDIGFDSGDNFVSRARDGAYYDISSDLDAYPALKELLPDEFLGGVTIDGGIYGIPTLKEMAETWALYVSENTLTRSNISAESIKELSDVEPILAALKADGKLGVKMDTNGTLVPLAELAKFDVISGAFVISNDSSIKTKQKKVVNYYETEEFEQFVRLMRSWYEKGYISSDVIENGSETWDNTVKVDPSKRGMYRISYAPLNEIGQSQGANETMIPLKLTPATISNNSTRGSVYCIYQKSENKQSSLKFLELWNTDKEMNTLIKFGIEGKHYTKIKEDGVEKVKRVDDYASLYLNQNWRSQNVLISPLEEGEPADKYEEYDKFNKSARKSCVLGFTPDFSNLEAEISACNAVVSTKANTLATGAVDPDDPEFGIEAIRKEMKRAGSDKVVTEIQKQYLNWLNEK